MDGGGAHGEHGVQNIGFKLANLGGLHAYAFKLALSHLETYTLFTTCH